MESFLVGLLLTILAVTATYGISYALVYTHGPFYLLEKLRDTKFMQEFGLLDCVPCVSLWVSVPIAVMAGHPYWFISWVGVWGCVIILDLVISTYVVK